MTNNPRAETEGLPFPLQEGEQVLKLCRRHWIHFWPKVVLLAIIGLGPPLVLGILLSEAGGYKGLAEKIFWIASAVYILYWALRAFLAWYRYRHDIWVITNQRLIDSSKRHPFSLRIATADLVNVQDMSVARNGVLATMLNFGDVICQTAAEMQDFKLSGIPDPREVQALVDRERDRERMRTR
jgi:hypothetical protein